MTSHTNGADHHVPAARRTVQCSASCDHGCGVEVPAGHDPWVAVLAAGWSLMLWRTPHDEGITHTQHSVYFCEPGCQYIWLRARVLIDTEARDLADMDQRAEALSSHLRAMQGSPHDHDHG